MPDELFYWLFNMSITASLVGLIILLLRRIRAIPRRVIRFLWLIPLIRCWIPVGISGKFGLLPLIARFTTKTVTVLTLDEDLAVTTTNFLMAAESYEPLSYKNDGLEKVFGIGACVWMIVGLAIVLTVAALYAFTLSETKRALRLPNEKNVYVTKNVTSPAVFGVFRPRILLPPSVTAGETESLSLILTHERAHIRAWDNGWRLIAFLTAALHWFNPLTWLFLKAALEDAELACDERVLSGFPEDKRQAYAAVLIECAGEKPVFVSALGGAKLRLRVERILAFQKLSWISGVLLAVFVGVIACVLLTNAG